MESFYEGIKESVRLSRVIDDDATPFESKYLAREILNSLLERYPLPAAGEPDTDITSTDGKFPSLTTTECRGVVEYLLGKNYAFCEETSDAKKHMLEALRLLSKSTRPRMLLLILIDLRNQLAVAAAEIGLAHIARRHLHTALDLYDAYRDAYYTDRMSAEVIESSKSLLPLVPRGTEIAALVYVLPRGMITDGQVKNSLVAHLESAKPEEDATFPDMPLNLASNVPPLKSDTKPEELPLSVLEMYCLEKHHARSTFYLGQVYARLEDPALAAAFCRRTLTYSLNVGVPANERAEWARNAIVLAEFYTRTRKLSHANTCLRAANAMLGVKPKFTVPAFEPLPTHEKESKEASKNPEGNSTKLTYDQALVREKQAELLARLAFGWGGFYGAWLAITTRAKILDSGVLDEDDEEHENEDTETKPKIEKSVNEAESTGVESKSDEAPDSGAGDGDGQGGKPKLTLDLAEIKSKAEEERRERQRLQREAKEDAELEHELASCAPSEAHEPPEQRASRIAREEGERELERQLHDASLLKTMDDIWFPALQPALGKAKLFPPSQKLSEATQILQQAMYYFQQSQRHFVLEGFVTEHVQAANEMNQCLRNMFYFDQKNTGLQKLCTAQRIAVLEPLATKINPRAFFEIHHDLTLQVGNAYAELMDFEYNALEELSSKDLSPQEQARKSEALENLTKYGMRAGSFLTNWQSHVPAADGTPGRTARAEPLPALNEPGVSEVARALSTDRLPVYKVPEEYLDSYITTGLRLARIYSRLVPQKKKQFVNMLRRSLAEHERLIRFIKLHGPEAEKQFQEQLGICEQMSRLTLMEIRKILSS